MSSDRDFFRDVINSLHEKNTSQGGKADEILKWCAAIFTRFQLVRRVLIFFMYIITWLMIRKLGLVFRLLKLTI